MNLLLLPLRLVLANKKVGHGLNEFLASILEATGRKIVGYRPNSAVAEHECQQLYVAAAILRRNRDLGRTQ